MDLILAGAVIAAVIIVLVVVALFFKIIKKALGIVLFVLAIILLLSSVSVYRDVYAFKTKFNESSNVFLLMDQKIIIAGFVQGKEGYLFFDEGTTEKYQGYIDTFMYDKIQGDNYKVFMIDLVAFEDEKDFDVLLAEKDQAKKSVAFSYIIADKLENDIMFFFREYKSQRVEVYPKTALFKFIDVIPFNYLKTHFEQIKMSIRQKIESFIKNRTEGLE